MSHAAGPRWPRQTGPARVGLLPDRKRRSRTRLVADRFFVEGRSGVELPGMEQEIRLHYGKGRASAGPPAGSSARFGAHHRDGRAPTARVRTAAACLWETRPLAASVAIFEFALSGRPVPAGKERDGPRGRTSLRKLRVERESAAIAHVCQRPRVGRPLEAVDGRRHVRGSQGVVCQRELRISRRRAHQELARLQNVLFRTSEQMRVALASTTRRLPGRR